VRCPPPTWHVGGGIPLERRGANLEVLSVDFRLPREEFVPIMTESRPFSTQTEEIGEYQSAKGKDASINKYIK
jgi:hypothetical protein